jgi:glutamate racemase
MVGIFLFLTMSITQGPIGIFDSGVGGISVWKEINQLLPDENTIYLADSIHAPYGPKGREEIIRLSKKNTDFLISKGAKIVIVACNTATTAAIDVLRQSYDLPFIGIEPAIKPAAIRTELEKVGVLATEGTLKSELFQSTSSPFRSKIKIYEKVGKGLVQAVENGDLDTQDTIDLLKTHLNPLIDHGIDKLVLGCTHYPFLKSSIEKIIPSNIEIIDSGRPVAERTKYILEKEKLLREKNKEIKHEFYTNSDLDKLSYFIKPNSSIELFKKDF